MAVREGVKRCSKCQRWKPVSDFWPRVDMSQTRTDPYQPYCNPCKHLDQTGRRARVQQERDQRSDNALVEDMAMLNARRGVIAGKEYAV